MPPVADDAIESLRRNEFTVTRDWAYLDHATFGPPPASHVRAATEALERTSRDGSGGLNGTELLESVRAEAAELLHCSPRHVCLLKSTSEGLGLLAEGLGWSPHDEVVVHEFEFEGCLAPFLNLEVRGVRVRAVPDLHDLERRLTERTRCVCLSAVDRVTGLRAPLEAIGDLCRARGIWLALDAAQAMGVLALDPSAIGADIVSAHGYKYLFSGFGLAPTYCSDRAISELRVPQAGWKNAGVERGTGGLSLEFADTAARFESTMSSLPGLAGMRESLRLLNSVDDIERRALAAAQRITDGLSARGYELCSPRPNSEIVSARHPNVAADEIVETLRTAGVAAAALEGRMRLSTHFYTTGADVDALFAALPDG
jgi:selenocysteine lyase/cysteine desulfurase